MHKERETERESERDREGQRVRMTERERDTHTERQRETQREKTFQTHGRRHLCRTLHQCGENSLFWRFKYMDLDEVRKNFIKTKSMRAMLKNACVKNGFLLLLLSLLLLFVCLLFFLREGETCLSQVVNRLCICSR